MKGEIFTNTDFPSASVFHGNLQCWPKERCWDWEWHLCELCL